MHGVVFPFLKDKAPVHHRQTATIRTPVAPAPALALPYSTASSTRLITSTTKPAAVAAANDRSTLSMMPPRCRRATFPHGRAGRCGILPTRVSPVVRPDVEIGTGAGPVCGLATATFTDTRQARVSLIAYSRRARWTNTGPPYPADDPAPPSGVFCLRPMDEGDCRRGFDLALSGCRKPNRLGSLGYGVAAQHLSLQ